MARIESQRSTNWAPSPLESGLGRKLTRQGRVETGHFVVTQDEGCERYG